MRARRIHRKVALAWGRWWAIQVFVGPYLSLGVHVDFARPYADMHVGWLIVSVGREPVMTNERDRHRATCRGFLFTDTTVL